MAGWCWESRDRDHLLFMTYHLGWYETSYPTTKEIHALRIYQISLRHFQQAVSSFKTILKEMQISPKLRNRKRSLRRVILPKDAIECVFLKQKYALKHLGTCKLANSFCFGLAGNLYVFNRRFQASFSLFLSKYSYISYTSIT